MNFGEVVGCRLSIEFRLRIFWILGVAGEERVFACLRE